MRKLSTYFCLLLAMMFVISSCQNELEQMEDNLPNPTDIELNREALALDVVDLLQSDQVRTQIIDELQSAPAGKSLEEVLSTLPISNERIATKLQKQVQHAKLQYEGEEMPEIIEVPELWMHAPKNADLNNLLISFAPRGDEKGWDKVKAFTLQGDVVYLDPFEEPNVPVIVVETKGFAALQVEVNYMNKMIQDAGFQNNTALMNRANRTANGGLETTKLDKIRLNDDQEPWISGAAEIYAITSGIRDNSNAPEIKVIPMYYLDHDGRDYYPNQILLFWDDYAYQAANIQLFEKDDNQNYQALASAIINGVFQIIGTVSGQPWVNVLGQVANAILQAMPSNWFTNDDDYVDSFYTIEKNRNYTNHYGAAGNAKVNMSPYFVPSN